jgi:hypothetical protein
VGREYAMHQAGIKGVHFSVVPDGTFMDGLTDFPALKRWAIFRNLDPDISASYQPALGRNRRPHFFCANNHL